jgi:hypothetical protein
MIDIFKSLCPVRYEPFEQIFQELDEVDQVIYLEAGKFEIGYEINRK